MDKSVERYAESSVLGDLKIIEAHQENQRSSSRSRSRSKFKAYEPCICSKSNCLKMYCSCFHKGVVCGEECKCINCKNTLGN